MNKVIWILVLGIGACDSGEQGPPGMPGAPGSQGEQGLPGASVTATALSPGDSNCPAGGTALVVGGETTYVCNGMDGRRAAFGHGGLGPVSFNTDTFWPINTTAPAYEMHVTDFSIPQGVVVTVPSGLVIRCTGSFSNEGTIVVEPFSVGEGQGKSAAQANCVDQGDAVGGGLGGRGLDSNAWLVRYPGPRGGGGGAAPPRGLLAGSQGGGTLVVVAAGTVTNSGTITANGAVPSIFPDSVGGGAGGIIVLASAVSISNTGTLSAVGAPGGDSSTLAGAGGGGGGGIIKFVAPSIEQGVTLVSGGAAGTLAAATGSTFGLVCAGGGGGGSGGGGGRGSGIGSDRVYGEPSEGSFGVMLAHIADPALSF